MNNSLLIFGTEKFNNSLSEIKEFLNFSFVFYNKDTFTKSLTQTINGILVDSDFLNNIDILDTIKNLEDKPLLLVKNKKFISSIKITFRDTIVFPLSLVEISNKVTNLIIKNKFDENSFVKIKEYVIDKNERKLKKGNLFITITEKEIQLIELLFNGKKPLPKNIILKKIWKYAENVDTHTVETHIYRLRKKILNRFNDENFLST